MRKFAGNAAQRSHHCSLCRQCRNRDARSVNTIERQQQTPNIALEWAPEIGSRDCGGDRPSREGEGRHGDKPLTTEIIAADRRGGFYPHSEQPCPP